MQLSYSFSMLMNHLIAPHTLVSIKASKLWLKLLYRRTMGEIVTISYTIHYVSFERSPRSYHDLAPGDAVRRMVSFVPHERRRTPISLHAAI